MGFKKKKKNLTVCLEHSFGLTDGDDGFADVVKSLCKKRSRSDGYKKLSKMIAIKITNGEIKRIHDYYKPILVGKDQRIDELTITNGSLEQRINELEGNVDSEVKHLHQIFKPELTTYEVLISIDKDCNDFRMLRNINRLSFNEAKYIFRALTDVKLVRSQGRDYFLTEKGVKYLAHYQRTDDIYLDEANGVIKEWMSVLDHLSSKEKYGRNNYNELIQRTQNVLDNLSGRVASKQQYKSFSKAYDDISTLLNNVNDTIMLKYHSGKHKKNYQKTMIFVKGLIKNLTVVSQIT